MATLDIRPFGGLNKRFPQHFLTTKKTQKVSELRNLLSLDGKIYKFPGAQKYDSTPQADKCAWAKRLYYQDQGDLKRFQFAILDRKMFKGDDGPGSMTQVKLGGSTVDKIENNFYPIDAGMQVGTKINRYLVDGKRFFRFSGNTNGDWEVLPDKEDIDGFTIEPTYIIEYLDRLWCLSKDRNALIFSKNLAPETFDDADDSGVIVLPVGNGGFPKSLIVHRGFLYVIHQDYFTPVSGTSVSTFGIRPGDVIYGYGTNAPRSVVNLKNQFGFLNSSDNEYYLSSGTLDSTVKEPLSYEVVLNKLINPTHVSKVVATLDSRLNAIRISYPSTRTTGTIHLDSEIIYSINEEKWCGETRDRNISCYSQWNGDGDNGEMITGRDDTGALMRESETFIDFDGAKTKIKLIMGSYEPENTDVIFEEFYIDAKPLGDTISIRYYLDARHTTRGEEDVSLSGETSSIGGGVVQLAQQDVFLNRFLPWIDRSKGRMIRFEVEDDVLNKKFELYGLRAIYNPVAMKTSKYIHGA